MSEPYHTIYDRRPLTGLGKEIPQDSILDQRGSNLGVWDVRPPLPRVWTNAYSAWNLAFVSAYPNAPMFSSKLFAPIVHLYQRETNQGTYLWARIICLYLHILYEFVSRSIGGVGRWPVVLKMGASGWPVFHAFYADWRSEWTTALFGAINKLAARQFQARLEAIFRCSPLEHKWYKTHRHSLKALWEKNKVGMRHDRQSAQSEELSFFKKLGKQTILPHIAALIGERNGR